MRAGAALGLAAGCLDGELARLRGWGSSAAWQDGLAGGDILCLSKPLSCLPELFSYRAKTLLNSWVFKPRGGTAPGCCS